MNILSNIEDYSKIYIKFHKQAQLQRRLVNDNNFTYRYLISVLKNNLKGVKDVLDVGCGTGAVDFYLAYKSITVTGIDISKKAIEYAKLNAANFGLTSKTRFYVSIFPNLKIGNKFDLIICSEILEHIPDDSQAVNKVYKLLKQGGTAIFSSPSVNAPTYRMGMAVNHDRDAGHLRRYDVYSFSKLIEGAGFKIDRIERNQGFFRDVLFMSPLGSGVVRLANRFGFVSKLLTAIDNLFLPIGESDIMVVARKI
jgi:SAM-dependent methyltransferase